MLALALFSAGCGRGSSDPVGTWRGLVGNPSGERVAFTLEVTRNGDQYVGALVNGEDRTNSTSGSFDGKTLRLRYDFYDGELTAVVVGDKLTGAFERQWKKQNLRRDLTATRAPAAAFAPGEDAERISGEWILKVGEAPNQRLWRAAFERRGGEVRGTIIPVSGDWGRLAGTFDNGRLALHRFDGINARNLLVQLTPQGTLEGTLDLGLYDPVRKVVAERLDANNKAAVASLPDPNNYTRMVDPTEPFRFSFPDLDGKLVANTDERFRNRVVIVSITGSWCPNCHDEAPVMQEFYDRYKAAGLEVVALAFEYTGEKDRDLEQLRIFAKRHGVRYPMLLAGTTEDGEAQRKMPQLVNFGAYPTAIFLGRDGRVRHIHAGFEGRATGERFTRLKTEMEARIRQLLEEGHGENE
ncbi:MAG: TlpA disulfide reductase family protein [Blastocatellia bacterium]|nr:TlpA disulfide reductase family protein [Blastocatellia bacterium]